MKQQFGSWMLETERKKPTTVYAYTNAIDKISKHYSEKKGKKTNLYGVKDLKYLEKIAADYSTNGVYAQFGEQGHGTIRNAVTAYVRFLRTMEAGPEHTGSGSDAEEEHPEVILGKEVSELPDAGYNFTYERDLRNALISQVEELFPGHKVFGDHQEGLEFSVEGHHIDILLENGQDRSLLAVELKSGTADFKVFGQISMNLGLLSKRFPDRSAKGVIIAGMIDDSLRYACATTDKISLKTYKMVLALADYT